MPSLSLSFYFYGILCESIGIHHLKVENLLRLKLSHALKSCKRALSPPYSVQIISILDHLKAEILLDMNLKLKLFKQIL